MIGYGVEDPRVAERAEVGDHQKHRQQKSEIANPIENEGLFACFRGGLAPEVKADQQVGGKADSFPPDEHEQEVFCEHQRQHEEHEQVEVGEIAPVTLFMSHVADGVDMDQKANAGDDQKHDQRQGIEQEVKINAKG